MWRERGWWWYCGWCGARDGGGGGAGGLSDGNAACADERLTFLPLLAI